MKGVVDSSGGDVRKPDGRIGQTLSGKWHVDRLIDVGGMANVYEVTHRIGRRAAIKVLHPSAAANPKMRRRFLRTAGLRRLLSRCSSSTQGPACS